MYGLQPDPLEYGWIEDSGVWVRVIGSPVVADGWHEAQAMHQAGFAHVKLRDCGRLGTTFAVVDPAHIVEQRTQRPAALDG